MAWLDSRSGTARSTTRTAVAPTRLGGMERIVKVVERGRPHAEESLTWSGLEAEDLLDASQYADYY